MSKKDQHIVKAIRQMPTYKAPEMVWRNISNELDAEEPLISAIDEYKHQTLKAPDLFEEVMDSAQPRRVIKLIPNTWLSGLAAGLALLITMYLVFDKADEQVTVDNYTEVTDDLPEMMTAVMQQMSEEDEVMGFIKTHCQQVALTCNTPKFQGLFELYVELDESKVELMSVMEENKNQQELTGYLIRVEKEKDEVGKQLIQMIIG